MPLSWNEIKTRATAFSKEWQNTQREEADAKPFLLKFLNILSISQRSLANLYKPNTMPPALVKAHQQLDKTVDECYRAEPFINETKRVEFLFELYDRYKVGMFRGDKKGEVKTWYLSLE